MRDYLASLSERGRTVPASARRALTVCFDALGIEWPLNNLLVVSSTNVESSEDPKQDPSTEMETVRKVELMATNPDVSIYNRSLAAGILLMTCACARFSDVQKLRPFEINEDSAHGTLPTSRTEKQHGHHRPWVCPRRGITKHTEWAKPLVDMRQAFAKVNGRVMPYAPPKTWF